MKLHTEECIQKSVSMDAWSWPDFHYLIMFFQPKKI